MSLFEPQNGSLSRKRRVMFTRIVLNSKQAVRSGGHKMQRALIAPADKVC
jgi:hypothetical protein